MNYVDDSEPDVRAIVNSNKGGILWQDAEIVTAAEHQSALGVMEKDEPVGAS